jgi:hypothetical protein
MNFSNQNNILSSLENKLNELMAVHAYQSATFIAEKLVTL